MALASVSDPHYLTRIRIRTQAKIVMRIRIQMYDRVNVKGYVMADQYGRALFRFAIRCIGTQSACLLEPLVSQLVRLYESHNHR